MSFNKLGKYVAMQLIVSIFNLFYYEIARIPVINYYKI